MYKKQLRFQKLACLLAVISAAVWFIYSLGMITDIHDALRYTMRDPNNLLNTKVAGSILYYDMQPFNDTFLYVSIGLILLSCLLYLTNTHVRRKYYIGNYVATGLFCAASLATTVWSHINIDIFKTRFLTEVDFVALKEQSEMFSNIVYTESTLMLDLHLAAASLAILSVAALAYNVYWKVACMKGENALLESGKEAAV